MQAPARLAFPDCGGAQASTTASRISSFTTSIGRPYSEGDCTAYPFADFSCRSFAHPVTAVT